MNGGIEQGIATGKTGMGGKVSYCHGKRGAGGGEVRQYFNKEPLLRTLRANGPMD